MPDEEGRFGGAGEALAAIDADRDRLRRRARAANWWYFPAVSTLFALVVAGPELERAQIGIQGYWWTPSILVVVAGLSYLQRRQAGVSIRLAPHAPSIVVAALTVMVVVGLYFAALMAERFAFTHVVGIFPYLAFAGALAGFVLLDRLGTLGSPRAR